MTNTPINNPKPILTEEHEEVIEVQSPVGGRKPIWVDEVDELYEFADGVTESDPPTNPVKPEENSN